MSSYRRSGRCLTGNCDRVLLEAAEVSAPGTDAGEQNRGKGHVLR